jgi:hypothetical protein
VRVVDDNDIEVNEMPISKNQKKYILRSAKIQIANIASIKEPIYELIANNHFIK